MIKNNSCWLAGCYMAIALLSDRGFWEKVYLAGNYGQTAGEMGLGKPCNSHPFFVYLSYGLKTSIVFLC